MPHHRSGCDVVAVAGGHAAPPRLAPIIAPRRVAVAVAVCLAAPMALSAAPSHAQEEAIAHRAGLVVQFGDGTREERCVTFDEPTITGLELLERSGLPLRTEVSSMGTSVCRIGDEGCADDEACWCQCETAGADCRFWSYQNLVDGAWTMAETGPPDRAVSAGDVDGWAWGAGSETAGAAMPVRTIADVCGQAAASGESTPTVDTAPVAVATETAPSSGAGAAGSRTGLLVAVLVAAGLAVAFLWLRRS